MARAFSSIPLLLLPRASSRAFCATPSLLSTAASSEEAPLLARRVGKADSLGGAAADGGHSRRHKRTKAWSRDRGVMAGIGAEIVSAGAPVLREVSLWVLHVADSGVEAAPRRRRDAQPALAAVCDTHIRPPSCHSTACSPQRRCRRACWAVRSCRIWWTE